MTKSNKTMNKKSNLLHIGFLSAWAFVAIILVSSVIKGQANATTNQILSNLDTSSFTEQKSIIDSQSQQDIQQSSPGLPIRLKIPKIGVDANIEHIGLTPQNAMDTPKVSMNAGWFNLGPRPGDIGSAVIDGHYGLGNRIPAVFDNLYKLKNGDKLYTEDEKGIITTFVVRDIRIYNKNQDALDIFNSNDGKAHLNIITCTGILDKISKNYSNRLIILTDKEI